MNGGLSRCSTLLVAFVAVCLLSGSVSAQSGPAFGPPAPGVPIDAAFDPDQRLTDLFPSEIDGSGPSFNPLTVLSGAGDAVAGRRGGSADEEGAGLTAALNVMLLLTVLALAPSIMLMTTCFLRILIVLGLLKQALGTQNLPPSQVITALALFMTMLVMAPTFDRVWDEAVVPYTNGEVSDYDELWDRASTPLRDFMFDQLEATGNWSSLYMVLNYRGVDTSQPEKLTRDQVDTISLVPAYMLSELKVAFIMGFRVYLPFLVIDMVIASLLISMSMMMLPPVLISLPFKLMLFVLVDGWTLLVGSLMESFALPGEVAGSSARTAVAPVAEYVFHTLGLVLPAFSPG